MYNKFVIPLTFVSYSSILQYVFPKFSKFRKKSVFSHSDSSYSAFCPCLRYDHIFSHAAILSHLRKSGRVFKDNVFECIYDRKRFGLQVGEEKMKNKTYLFIDGTNLYAGQYELFGPDKYLDFSKFIKQIENKEFIK